MEQLLIERGNGVIAFLQYEHKNDPSASLTEQLDKLNTLDMLSLIVATGTVGDAIWQDDVREAIEQAVMEAF